MAFKKKAIKNAEMPELLTVSPSPHIKTRDTTRSMMLDVLIALLPAYVWGVVIFGYRALLLGAVAVGASVVFEAVFQKIMKKKVTVSDCSAAVTGLLLAMNLSVAVPVWMPVVGSFFAIVIVKQLFGGLGKNIVNPALAARVFLFSWAGEMSTFTTAGERINSLSPVLSETDIVASATPLASLKAGTVPGESLFDTFIGNTAGCIGEVSAVLLILGGLYLLVRRVITWHIPVAYLGTVAALTYLFPKMSNSMSFMFYELCAGGLMLGALFMATDYATSPMTPRGRIIYGVGCGAITVLIRYFGGYREGVSFAILIMNLLVWYLDLAGMPRRFGKGSKIEREEKKKLKEQAEKDA